MLAYEVYLDSNCILNSSENINTGVRSATLSIEIKEPGSFEFKLIPNHPIKSNITIYKSIVYIIMSNIKNGITLDSYIPFMGRVKSIDEDIYGYITCTCEGVYATLKDIYVDEYVGTTKTVDTVLNKLFNEQMVYILGSGYAFNYVYSGNNGGNKSWSSISTSEGSTSVDSSDRYRIAADVINNEIIDKLGGFMYYVFNERSAVDGYPCDTDITYYKSDSSADCYFDYNTPSGDLPVKKSSSSSDILPRFTYDSNIIDVTRSPVKTGIWTGLFPVGKNGLLLDDPDPDYRKEPVSSDNLIWVSSLVNKYGKILKRVEFPKAEDMNTLRNYANQYVTKYASTDWFGMKNHTLQAIEPCLVSDFNKLVKIAYPGMVQIDDTNVVCLNCLSIKHDLFDAEKSEYVFGPIVPDNVINEDLSRWK